MSDMSKNMVSEEFNNLLHNIDTYAKKNRYNFITVDMLMLNLMELKDSQKVFSNLGVNITKYINVLQKNISEESSSVIVEDGIDYNPRPTASFQLILKQAIQYAQSVSKPASLNHVIAAIFDTSGKDRDIFSINFLENEFNISKKDVLDYLMHGKVKESDSSYDEDESVLDAYTTDLNKKAKEGKIDPVIGRDAEVERVIEILSRRYKSNPILVGEAGVGKTAIAEGLAKRIVEGNVPDNLKNIRVFTLEMASLVAGTKYRGDFESRIKVVIDTLKEDKNIVLFVDEIHTLIGAGSTGAGNTMDAANLLKPALSNGSIRCIGATTNEEYRKIFEKEQALARRFQKVKVN